MTHASPPAGNAARMLWDSAERGGDRIALRERSAVHSYDALLGRAGAIAAALQGAGVAEGDRVVVFLERGADAAAACFGVWAAGAVLVMVNEALRPRQVEYVAGHTGARFIVTSGALLDRLHRPLATEAELVRVEDVAARAEYRPVARAADQLAQITYTSGSSGLPKGVMATHGNVWAAITTVAGYLGLRADDRVASVLPFSSVYGANQLLCALATGAELLVERSPVANQIASALREGEATVLAGVPPFWMQLLEAPEFHGRPIDSLRILQNAGGHLAPWAVRRLREIQPGARLFLQYGMTEVFRSTFLPPEEVDAQPGAMGRPIPGAELLVLREDLTPCGADEVGELVHAGPTVTRGYWNDPERTAQVFRPHPLRPGAGPVVFSGDMVRRGADGVLHFVGRRDRMIKTLGYRVGPDEIVDAMYASGEITEGAVTTEPDPRRGERILAFVVLKPEGSLRRLEAFCRTELPRYMHPARFEALETIPRNAGGKHDLVALHTRLVEQARASAAAAR